MDFLKILFTFLEGGREEEREGNINVVTSCVPPTGDMAHNPDMCPSLGIEPATL